MDLFYEVSLLYEGLGVKMLFGDPVLSYKPKEGSIHMG